MTHFLRRGNLVVDAHDFPEVAESQINVTMQAGFLIFTYQNVQQRSWQIKADCPTSVCFLVACFIDGVIPDHEDTMTAEIIFIDRAYDLIASIEAISDDPLLVGTAIGILLDDQDLMEYVI
jgi:hypothetical protein